MNDFILFYVVAEAFICYVAVKTDKASIINAFIYSNLLLFPVYYLLYLCCKELG